MGGLEWPRRSVDFGATVGVFEEMAHQFRGQHCGGLLNDPNNWNVASVIHLLFCSGRGIL